MTEATPNPLPLSNAVCMHCGYDISGTIPDDNGLVTCPECGIELKRSDRNPLTRRDVHMRLVKMLVLPFVIWAFITTLSALPPFEYSLATGIAMLAFILGYPVTLLIMFISAWARLYTSLEPHPRPYPRWTIPLWVSAYGAAMVAIFIGTLVLMDAM